MLANTLSTNEIKGTGGTGVTFDRVAVGPGQQTQFQYLGTTPATPHYMYVKHNVLGNGTAQRRESVIIFDLWAEDENDATKFKTSVQLKLVNPIGAAGDNSYAQVGLAYMMSFLASLGASTTILYDGTGNGAKTLLNGTL